MLSAGSLDKWAIRLRHVQVRHVPYCILPIKSSVFGVVHKNRQPEITDAHAPPDWVAHLSVYLYKQNKTGGLVTNPPVLYYKIDTTTSDPMP